MAKTKELEETKARLPAGRLDYGEDAGQGMEGIGAGDLLIPFLRILQSNSPEVNEADGKYVPGARPGMIFNTATKECYDGLKEGLPFVAAKRDLENFMQWHSRDAGGGLAEVWDDPQDPRIAKMRERQKDKQARRGFGRIMVDPEDEKSDLLVQTKYLHGVALPHGENPVFSAIAFSSTQIKKHKQVTTLVNQWFGVPAQAPLYALRWRLKTVPEKNSKGSFFGWKIEPDAETWRDALIPRGDPVYNLARELAKGLKEGTARSDYSGLSAEDAEAEEQQGGTADEEEIPLT